MNNHITEYYQRQIIKDFLNKFQSYPTKWRYCIPKLNVVKFKQDAMDPKLLISFEDDKEDDWEKDFKNKHGFSCGVSDVRGFTGVPNGGSCKGIDIPPYN